MKSSSFLDQIGTFKSKAWGTVRVLSGHYGAADGPLAIVLECENGEPLAALSVNMYRPECSHDSRDLPPDCFYVKLWGGNASLADEAFASGLFVERDDLPIAASGFVEAPAWQVKP